ncbi:MAG: acetolactate decarboxylase [Methanoregula sp.]|jgi:acetolactate decarboxylase
MDYKFLLGIGVAVAIIFFVAAFATSLSKQNQPTDRETLYQVSTIDALMQGVFDGVETVGDLKKHGDFGIGTFDALDGEMIVLDGKYYQAKADGRIYPAPDNATTPFATVTDFSTDIKEKTDHAMNFSVFSATMSARLPSANMIYAVKIHDTFPLVKVRAIPAQHKPYPTLADAAENQSVYTYSKVTGTIVGFYTPVIFKGLNVPGYHLHFIADDHLTGGHILEVTIPENSTVEYDITPGFATALPTSGAFTGVDLSQDQSAALAKVEQ